MSRKKTTVSELRVGLLAIAAIAILIIFILSVTGDISLFKRRLSYTTRFAAAEGLTDAEFVSYYATVINRIAYASLDANPSGFSTNISFFADAVGITRS